MARTAGKANAGKRGATGALPSREEVLAFIAAHPGKAGKREIARAFGVGGADRVALKRLLRDLGDEGRVTGGKRRLTPAGDLPGVAVLAVTGRTADGDLLAAPEEWSEEAGPPPSILVLPPAGRGRRTAGPAPAIGDRILARLTPVGDEIGAAYTARPIKVLDRRPATALGVARRVGSEWRLEPVDRRQKSLVLLPEGTESLREGDLVAVAVAQGGRRTLAPRARLMDVVGSMTSEKAVSMIALHAHGIPHVFPDAVLGEARAARSATAKGREDWQDLALVTIDPADARDHDDAVHAMRDADPANPGGFVVTVAIADVAWHVRPASAMDREARRRGNSVYFPDRVVPMLPERISNDLCSLVEGKARPALAVRMVFGADGRKRRHHFHRILMRSAAKLSYAEAQSAFDDRPEGAAIAVAGPVLAPLWEAYRTLALARAEREPLELEIPERKVIVGKDGAIDRIVVPPRLEAHRLIEEFMIQANVAAAETLEEAGSPLVYRIHDSPSLAKLEALRDFLSSIEITFPHAGNLRPSHFNRILSRLKATEHGQLIHEIVLRTQSQAEYSPANIGHFGLNLRRYAHFTSPIRRYADLLVHRALIGALRLGEGALPKGIEDDLPAIAAEISAAERRAMVAERDTIDRLVAHWLADRIGATFAGRIAGVTRAGLFVKLDETGADGFVPISTLGADYFIHDEARHAVVGRDSGETHRLGDAVEVRLLEVAPLAGALRFELLTEGHTTRPAGGRRDGRPGRARNRAGAGNRSDRKRRTGI